MSAIAWPVAREVPAGWCTIPTGTLARGMRSWSFATGVHPRRFLRPAVWIFATAWAPCLCASEARPSDRGIQLRGIRPRHLRIQPLVRRETVAAGRGFRSATTLHPGAGPASPDIASSGVSEGGTRMSLRGWKWAGMKKLCFVDFVGKKIPGSWRLTPPPRLAGGRGFFRFRPSPRRRDERQAPGPAPATPISPPCIRRAQAA